MATQLQLQHFAVLQVSYFHTPTSIIITCTTNNPCHLTCYYTHKEPLRHTTTRVVRGLALPWGAYWCFVAWKSVEQQEPGDTLIHTFEVPDWSYCQTKWFTFRGTVATILSPSVTAIIKHHHPGVLPALKDAYIKKDMPDTNYDRPTLWARDDAEPDSTNRSLISFDLSTLTPGTTPKTANLSMAYIGRSGTPQGKQALLYKLTRPTWLENEATWNRYTSTTPWATPGADFVTTDPNPAITIIPTWTGEAQILTWDVLELVKDALLHNQNLHLILRIENDTGTNYHLIVLASRTNFLPHWRPFLGIT